MCVCACVRACVYVLAGRASEPRQTEGVVVIVWLGPKLRLSPTLNPKPKPDSNPNPNPNPNPNHEPRPNPNPNLTLT